MGDGRRRRAVVHELPWCRFVAGRGRLGAARPWHPIGKSVVTAAAGQNFVAAAAERKALGYGQLALRWQFAHGTDEPDLALRVYPPGAGGG